MPKNSATRSRIGQESIFRGQNAVVVVCRGGRGILAQFRAALCAQNMLCLSHDFSTLAKGILMHTCVSCKRVSPYNRRGCCAACYERYSHWVTRGEVTWTDLEAMGRTRPRQHTRGTVRAYWAAAHPPHPGPPPAAVRPQTVPRRPWGHGEALQQALAAIAALAHASKEE
jgi:hypothetical protein